jgi:hypothetical protein
VPVFVPVSVRALVRPGLLGVGGTLEVFHHFIIAVSS